MDSLSPSSSGFHWDKFQFRDKKYRAQRTRKHTPSCVERRICKLISVVCRELCATKRCLIAEWYMHVRTCNRWISFYGDPVFNAITHATSLSTKNRDAVHSMGLFPVALPSTFLRSGCARLFQWKWKSSELSHKFYSSLSHSASQCFSSLLQYNIGGYHSLFVCDHTPWMYVRELIDHFLSISQHICRFIRAQNVAKTAIKWQNAL